MSRDLKYDEIRKRRDDAIEKADRKYRWALEDASDKMRDARQTYLKEEAEAQAQWRKELRELNG